MENNNKRTLILSIVGILVLVIAVVGVSFAMFTFTGTGTKENVIKTGSISIDFSDETKENHINVSNELPMTDEQAMAQTDDDTTFTVEGSWGSTPLTINYEVGLTDIVPGNTLTSDYVKVAVKKGTTYTVGSANGGVAISTLQNVAGPLNIIQNYYVGNGSLTNEGTEHLSDTFTVKAYTSSDYTLPADTANSTSPEVSGGTASNSGGTVHKKTTKAETYSFKVTIKAQQA